MFHLVVTSLSFTNTSFPSLVEKSDGLRHPSSLKVLNVFFSKKKKGDVLVSLPSRE